MRTVIARALLMAAAAVWLAGCNTTDTPNRPFGMAPHLASIAASDAHASAPPEAPEAVETTGSVAPRQAQTDDDIVLGKQDYRANKFDAAAKLFSRAAERNPRSSEAWLGLAASYDRLRQFDLADSAYEQAIGIDGQTAEILNNQGYSYLLRGDLMRARAKLTAAQRKEPGNKYVQNNLALLADASAKKKAAQ